MTFLLQDLNTRSNFVSGKLIVLLFLVFVSIAGYGQNSCAEKLEEAEKYYESGQIDNVEPLLNDCLEDGFTKEEKARAYRLLTLCKLYYNQDEEAKKSFLELLKVDKEYKIKESDPSEFVNLYKDFRTFPVVIVGVKYGMGLLGLYGLENYNDINSLESNSEYETNMTHSFGLSFETPIFKQLSVSYEFYYYMYSYAFTDTILDYAAIKLNESVSSIDIPILLQWNFLKNDFVPYANIGMSFNYLLSAKTDIARNDKEGVEYRPGITLSDMDLTEYRNSFNYAITAGLGFRWKNLIGPGYLTCDIRYSRYLNNYVKPESRAEDSEMLYTGLTTDNVFKMQNMQFLIGYKLPFYKPKHKGK
ncbi:MAG: outer membrane beta-barrel protein [Bacteroidales bacterium]|nr:outer membrane beta-barrel protein [Bacteroidales bacterium]